jgi:hypothetical protein
MEIRIRNNYSLLELQAITVALISSKIITVSEALPLHELQGLSIDFFDINDLLRPIHDRMVSYSNDARKGWFDQSETDYFYHWFALQLLRNCPLSSGAPTCQDEVAAISEQDRFILKAGASSAFIYYHHLNHPEFISQLVGTVNHLLEQNGFEVAYYEIRGLDETALFLLLTPQQYHHALTDRLIHFANIDYPEVDTWRSALREEDFLF